MPESIKENTSALPILSRCCRALAHVFLFSVVNTPMGYSAVGAASSKMYFRQAKRSVGCKMLPDKVKINTLLYETYKQTCATCYV